MDLGRGDVDRGTRGSPRQQPWLPMLIRGRLVQETRRLLSTQPGEDPMLPCVRGRETDWPPLWPVRSSSGAPGIGYPEGLYPRNNYTQSRQKKTSTEEVAVEKEAGKTSDPTRTTL